MPRRLAGRGAFMQKLNILYVDDDASSRLMLTSILEDIGYKVIAVEDSPDALDLLEGAPFDLILLSYQLLEMTGAELAREIRGIYPHAPIVLLSGEAVLSAKDLLYVDAYCVEGTTLDELVLTIEGTIPRVLTPGNYAGSSGVWASST